MDENPYEPPRTNSEDRPTTTVGQWTVRIFVLAVVAFVGIQIVVGLTFVITAHQRSGAVQEALLERSDLRGNSTPP